MFEDFFNQIGPWAWVLIGLVLLVLEIFVAIPGSLFLFTGIAAIIVGALALLFGWDWNSVITFGGGESPASIDGWVLQLAIFGVLSLILVIFGRRFFARRDRAADAINLNARAARLVGSSFILVDAIVDGSGGRVKVGDSTWRAVGPDMPSGTRVKVIGYDGTILRVEPEFPA